MERESAQAITEESIRSLVDGFYGKVRLDSELGPIFERAIGSSIEAWKPHLQKMYDFWSSITLFSGRYSGQPMRKHLDLPPFPLELFDRWLALFHETADELFAPELSQVFKLRSQMIAQNLRQALTLYRA
jgi:hemoglobin